MTIVARGAVQNEVAQRASWTTANLLTRDEAVLGLTTQLGGLAGAHGRDDRGAVRMLAVRLAGDAVAIIESIDRDALA